MSDSDSSGLSEYPGYTEEYGIMGPPWNRTPRGLKYDFDFELNKLRSTIETLTERVVVLENRVNRC